MGVNTQQLPPSGSCYHVVIVIQSLIESEGIPKVGSDFCLLLALNEGHGWALAPEKGWSGTAGSRLGKV